MDYVTYAIVNEETEDGINKVLDFHDEREQAEEIKRKFEEMGYKCRIEEVGLFFEELPF